MPRILSLILAIIFWSAFGWVVLQIDYPNSLSTATLLQLSTFFVSLILALVFTLNVFFQFLFFSIPLALGIIILLILKALDSLNIISAALTILAVGLFLSYFRKVKRQKRLTSHLKIPKLTHLRRRK